MWITCKNCRLCKCEKHFCESAGSGARALLLQFFPLNQGASKGAKKHGAPFFRQCLINSSVDWRGVKKV
ncbi:hypothetical protein PSAC2689_70069 [Paraburkholderia sacchari]